MRLGWGRLGTRLKPGNEAGLGETGNVGMRLTNNLQLEVHWILHRKEMKS